MGHLYDQTLQDFSATGILSGARGFEFRPQQQEMAGAVARALETDTALLAEAGYAEGEISFELAMDSSSSSNTQLVYQIVQQYLKAIGINAEEYERKYLLPFAPLDAALEQCRRRGHALKMEGGYWRLTPEGFLLSNSIISDLLLIQDQSKPLAKRR